MGVDPGLERAIRTAAGPNGVLDCDELRALGLSPDAIRARVRSGRLVRLFHKAYAVAHPSLLPFARPAAALKSFGDDAVLSHRSAAAIRGLADPDPGTIDVTLSGRQGRPRPGIRIHRVIHLHPADITTYRSLPITTLARTMIDFAAEAPDEELTQAFGDARAKHGLTDAALDAALARAPANHPGVARLRRLRTDGGTYDRSTAEKLLRRNLKAAGLPQPQTNRRLPGGATPDFLWPDLKLIVEVDGWRTHGNREAFENDRKRDQFHAAAGYAVIRITWRQLQHEPFAVIARIAQAMAHRGAAAA